LLVAQGGTCAICKKPETAVDKRTKTVRDLSVDHCHETHKVRGLLCQNHNTALGLFKHDVDLCLSAIKYLKS